MQGDAMYAMADLGSRVGNILGFEAVINRFPGIAAVIGSEAACCRDRNIDSLRIFGIDQNRVQTQSARAGRPLGTGAMAAQSSQLMPRLAAVIGAKHGGIFDTGVTRIWIIERRFKMPHALEFPRMGGAIIPLMRSQWFACFG